MHFTLVAGLAAMAVGVSAQTSVSPDVANSVLLVLATALPAEERSYALASSSAFAAQMASSLAAGNTPAWYASLPAEVKSILPQLYPAAAEATTTTSTTPVVSATPTPYSTVLSVSAAPTGASNSTVSSVHSATLSAGSSTAPTAPVLPEATGAASSTRVALGAGIAGVVGFLGMLAL